jgi:catechol 2,3-dioxygenase-like lactoylglutathione lyase family enzyme
LPRTGFIDHIGIGVPDLAAAKRYYDDLTRILGLRQWFKTSPEGSFNYGPDGARGSQLFFYGGSAYVDVAIEPSPIAVCGRPTHDAITNEEAP